MRDIKRIAVFTACFVLAVLGGCKKQAGEKAGVAGTDYSIEKNWAIKCEDIKHEIDVFFVHPTTYGPPANGKYNADLDDEELNAKTDFEAVNWMTAAYSENCNVFAPRYRQVNIEVLSMPEEKRGEYFKYPVADIKNAFAYYLENLNGGRPFILASHSQGSNVLQLILMANPEMIDKEKLVAAYMVGWTFTDEQLEQMGLELCNSPEQTGCLISWNTIGIGGSSPTLNEGARCVNPLSWTSDTEEYPASMNKAAKILFADGTQGVIENFTSAKINDAGGLVVQSPKADVAAKLNMSMGEGCYHRYDYDFFFYNIIDNVKLRCDTYLEEHKSDSK